MIAVNSRPVPRTTSALRASRTWITATSQAAVAVPMNKAILTRLIGTPMLRAACGLPPTPKIQFPNEVRSRIQVASAASPTHHRIETEKSARPTPMLDANTRRNPAYPGTSSRPLTTVRPVIWRVAPVVAPRMISSVPRVTMNEGNPVRRTR